MARKKRLREFFWWLLPCGTCGSTFLEHCRDRVEPYSPKHSS